MKIPETMRNLFVDTHGSDPPKQELEEIIVVNVKFQGMAPNYHTKLAVEWGLLTQFTSLFDKSEENRGFFMVIVEFYSCCCPKTTSN